MTRCSQYKTAPKRHALVAAVAVALTLGMAQYTAAQGFPAILPLSGLDGATGFRLDGVAASDFAGRVVSAAGDINGDGFGDVIVGAHGADPNGLYYAGSSFVVFGHSGGFAPTLNLSALNGSNGFRINGSAAQEHSGFSVNAAGDVNGDGFGDLLIGAYRASPNGSLSGSTYVLFGHTGSFAPVLEASALDGSTGFRLTGAATGDYSGFATSAAGDVNGDGVGDLIVGAHRADPNGAQSGSSYVVFGHTGSFAASINLSTMNGVNGFRIAGAVANDYAGRAVSGAGDVNGDGYDDVIIGSFTNDANGSNTGSSYVVFGHTGAFVPTINLSTLDGNNGFRLDGVNAQDYSGLSVSTAGDVNGDGFADVIVSAALADPNGGASGSSYVVFGHSGSFAATQDLGTLNGSNGFRLDGVLVNDDSGRSVSGGGDLNGDGIGDVLVGAAKADPHGSESGSSYVVFGHLGVFPATFNLGGLDGINGFRVDGVGAGDRSGFWLSSAGDMNGDGIDELIVGAYRASPNGAQSGSAYVVFGRDTIVVFRDGFE